nr:MAG TPA: hypothetical protein [Caudoviricetes sp.]
MGSSRGYFISNNGIVERIRCDLSTNDFSIHVIKLLNNTTLLTLTEE